MRDITFEKDTAGTSSETSRGGSGRGSGGCGSYAVAGPARKDEFDLSGIPVGGIVVLPEDSLPQRWYSLHQAPRPESHEQEPVASRSHRDPARPPAAGKPI